MRTVRVVLLLDLVAAAGAGAVLALAIALPLAARGPLGPGALVAVVASVAGGVVVAGVALLFRAVARPVDRIVAAAARLGGAAGELPLLAGREGAAGPGLSGVAVAFERLTAALADERARLGAKVREVEAANAALAEAHESLLRSERLATVGRLAAGIAHEVGNPLGAITGYAELARARVSAEGPAPDAPAEDFLARIGVEARRIDLIVRDLLDFARPAALRLEAVDVAAAVEAAARIASVQPRLRGVAVRIEVPDGVRVLADERRLAQVLVNLLLNAADAMRGAGEVRVSAARRGERVEVTVADRGPGIAEADLPRIFDPFFTTKEPGQGSGLGLAVSHGIMESFGGTIRAENAPDGGAVFRLDLGAYPGSVPPAGPAASAC